MGNSVLGKGGAYGRSMAAETVGFITSFLTYFGYALLVAFGYVRDFFSKRYGGGSFSAAPKGYADLVNDFEYFFVRRLFARIRDCWDRPICSKPGAHITVLDRGPIPPLMDNKPLQRTSRRIDCLNLGSYNYLGFADGLDYCTDHVLESLDKYGVGVSGVRAEFGTTVVHAELERLVAQFLGKESAVVFGMGFQTNSTVLPQLVGKGGLIVSDSLNHASLVAGCKCSPAKIMMFRHNDMEHLEKVVREAVAMGQPRTRRPWTMILLVVEGIYSMEGEICNLPEIIRIKKKYGCYVYMDEAHSIGALGARGRGICDFWGVDPSECDVLMGTFTKSLGPWAAAWPAARSWWRTFEPRLMPCTMTRRCRPAAVSRRCGRSRSWRAWMAQRWASPKSASSSATPTTFGSGSTRRALRCWATMTAPSFRSCSTCRP